MATVYLPYRTSKNINTLQRKKHSNVIFIILSTRSQEMSEKMPMDIMNKAKTDKILPWVWQS